MTDLLLSIIVYCVVSLVLFTTLLLVLWRLFRKLVRSQIWRRGWSRFRMADSLLGLGVAALLKPTLFSRMIGLVIDIFYQLLFGIPLRVIEGLRPMVEQCDVYEPVLSPDSDCLRMTFGVVTQTWGQASSNLLEDVRRFPYPSLVVFLIAWGLTASLFRYLRQSDESGNRPRWRLWLDASRDFLRSQAGRVFTRNVSFFVIIFIGGYLSLASIAAIPILEQSAQPDDIFSADTLAQQLQVEHTQIEQSFPKAQQAADPFASLKDWIGAESAQIDAYTRQLEAGETITLTAHVFLDEHVLRSMRNRLRRVEGAVSEYEKALTQIQSDWETMRSGGVTNLAQAKDEAVRSYRFAEQSRIGVYENTEHYFQLTDWYSRESSAIRIKLEQCENELNRVNLALRSWSDDLGTTLEDTPDPTVDVDLSVNLPVGFGFDSCREHVGTQSPMPVRQSLGALYLGPFGLVASWLLQTESFSLALITGMLGFGLLGAAASTVIREGDETESLVSNLSGVVIRGSLAAVVVFLAVEGGLGVFTQGDTDPNPYVLLFTCLIGAVYSEVIWERAKDYLIEQVNKRRSKREASQPENGGVASGGSDADDEIPSPE